MKEQDRFTKQDIREDIRAILGGAFFDGLIQPIDLFLLGMDQMDQDDWEQYDGLVHHIENLLPCVWPEDHISSTQTHKTTRMAISDYWQNQHEAKLDSACEVME